MQVLAQDRQQQQHHDAAAEGDELHNALGAASAEIGNSVAPCDADAAAQPARERHQRQTGKGEYATNTARPALK